MAIASSGRFTVTNTFYFLRSEYKLLIIKICDIGMLLFATMVLILTNSFIKYIIPPRNKKKTQKLICVFIV